MNFAKATERERYALISSFTNQSEHAEECDGCGCEDHQGEGCRNCSDCCEHVLEK